MIEAAAVSLAGLYGRATMGAANPVELAACVPFLVFIGSLLQDNGQPKLTDAPAVLNLMRAVDVYARMHPDGTVPLNGRDIATTSNIITAVGIMLRVAPGAPHKMRERQDAAGSILGYSYKEMTKNRKMSGYQKEYCKYIRSVLQDPSSRAEVLRLASAMDHRVDEPDLVHSSNHSLSNESPNTPDWLRHWSFRNDGDPPLVERPDYFDKVREWFESSNEVLLLAGDSGNGKSTIAKESLQRCIMAVSGALLAYIDASNIHSFTRSLNKYVEGGPYINEKDAVDEFVRAIGTDEHRARGTVVLLDNAVAFEQIEQIAYWSPRVVITAEERLIPEDFPRANVRIDVESMELGAACELISWFRPNELPEAARFAGLVGSKPRIIVDCLGMYEPGDMTLTEMSDLIEEEQVRLIQRSGTSDRAVDRLYRTYFDRLESGDFVASILLACIAHLSVESVPASICGRTIEEFARLNPELGRPNATAISVYAKPLIRRYLVWREGSMICSHGVTTRLFRDVTAAKQADVVEAFVKAYFNLRPRRMKESIGHIYPELVKWAPTICAIIKNIPSVLVASIDSAQIDLLVADVRVGMTSLGRFEDYLDLIHSNNGISLGYIEYSQMLNACYSYGRLRRDEYVSMTKSFRESNPQVKVDLHSDSNLAMAEYKVRDFALKSQLKPSMHAVVLDEAAKTVSSVNYLWRICEISEWLGLGEIAKSAIAAVDRDTLIARPVVAGNAAGAAIRFYRRHPDVDALDSWYAYLRRVGDNEELTGSRLFEASLSGASAWLARGRIFDVASARDASDLFVVAAHDQVVVGYRRMALELFVEAQIIERLFGLVVESDQRRKLLQDLLASLDEPHLHCRLKIVEQYLILRDGMYSLKLGELHDLTVIARDDYEDIVGYSLGLSAQAMLLNGRNSRKGELRKLTRELSRVIESRFAFSGHTDVAEWLSRRISEGNLLVRI